MASEPENPREILPTEATNSTETFPSPLPDEESKSLSKKAAKKEANKAKRLEKKQEAASATATAAATQDSEADPLSANYGDVPIEELQSKEVVSVSKWTEIQSLSEELKDQEVLIRGQVHTSRVVGKNMAFLVVRESGFTVQCVVTVTPEVVSRQMVKFAKELSRESYVDIEGTVSVPGIPITGASQQVEVQVKKIHCISKAVPNLPINIEDAARSELEIEKAEKAGEKFVRVGQDTRLNYRVLDLRTPANQGIFRIQCQVENYERKTLRLTFKEGVQLLQDAGVQVDPLGDLNTETERKLGQLVREKYNTDFYILHRYPLAVRPFYTMPCYDDPAYSNSFDVFVRGEEIISGAQRVHVPEFLAARAEACGIDVKTISTYIDSFRYGAPPHGGFGVGLERVVMLFCALNNIRKTSLFPRDPQRLAP